MKSRFASSIYLLDDALICIAYFFDFTHGSFPFLLLSHFGFFFSVVVRIFFNKISIKNEWIAIFCVYYRTIYTISQTIQIISVKSRRCSPLASEKFTIIITIAHAIKRELGKKKRELKSLDIL